MRRRPQAGALSWYSSEKEQLHGLLMWKLCLAGLGLILLTPIMFCFLWQDLSAKLCWMGRLPFGATCYCFITSLLLTPHIEQFRMQRLEKKLSTQWRRKCTLTTIWGPQETWCWFIRTFRAEVSVWILFYAPLGTGINIFLPAWRTEIIVSFFMF